MKTKDCFNNAVSHRWADDDLKQAQLVKIAITSRAADRLIFLIAINRVIKKINRDNRNINRIYICYV